MRGGLGTFWGVFVPCVSSIVGAVAFVRMSWAVGQAGWGGTLVMLGIGILVNLMTALSLAAISTNGQMKGGGAYFMISRSIGPEFGVAVGFVFALAQCIATSFAMVAFAETFADSILCNVEPCSEFHVANQWEVFGIASLVLLAVFVASMVGGSAVLDFSNVITLVMMVSLVLGCVSLLASNGEAALDSDNMAINAWFNFTDSSNPDTAADGDQDFLSVFVILFPATTGIMSGAGASGKLKDPALSIGPGTIGAIAATNAIYVSMVLVFGLCVDRYTLQTNKSVFRESCFSPGFIVVGILTCTLSSALGNLNGAAGLFQALARDELLPMFRPFAQSSKRDGEPQVALMACWVIAQTCLLYGKLDAIASLVTDFCLLVYIFLNIACFALKVTGAPNFRPRFAYFSWHTALVGALSALTVMFVTSPFQGLLAFLLTSCFAYYVHVTAPAVPWGDVSQALIYHQVRKYLLRLDVRRSHPKFWRPSILFLPEFDQGQLQLLDFCNNLKKGGLYIIGNVIQCGAHDAQPGAVQRDMGDLALNCERLKQLWLELLDLTGAKAFHEVVLSPTWGIGKRSLLMSAGLGGLRPNTVCIQYYLPDNSRRTSSSSSFSSASGAEAADNAIFDSGDQQQGFGGLLQQHQQSRRRQFARAPAHGAGFGSIQAHELVDEIQHLLQSFNSSDLNDADDDFATAQLDYCQLLADVLVLEKNLLIARHFDQLDKDEIVNFRARRRRNVQRRRQRSASGSVSGFRRRATRFRFTFTANVSTESDSELDEVEGTETETEDEDFVGFDNPSAFSDRLTTVDLWSTDEADWNDPCGTLALEMQLAFGLHRTDIWEEHTKLRVIAACKSVRGAQGSEEAHATARKAYETLKKLLRAIRVEAEVLVLPAVGAALFEDGRDESQPLTQMEHCAELNTMVMQHSTDKACVVFLPLPRPHVHPMLSKEAAQEYLENLDVLTQGLPPTILVSPGANISPIVTTEI
ncbi:Solute carrier family 12 member 9 (Cation-chloride cotransporter-interacting protein 1) [Durusdinium trenchii]|uniref:Solute carrier family 12 member 9 (Cation-chloride cotransporter-interacting protein 1) n=1 Tax=Durusdinium trenchii TaxID=1381693 RepID=A0ABP0JJ71_9DINO